MVEYTCYPNYPGNISKRLQVQSDPGINKSPFFKIPKAKKAGGIS
jgi:hypothetical protein